jgi:hypothetical protein
LSFEDCCAFCALWNGLRYLRVVKYVIMRMTKMATAIMPICTFRVSRSNFSVMSQPGVNVRRGKHTTINVRFCFASLLASAPSLASRTGNNIVPERPCTVAVKRQISNHQKLSPKVCFRDEITRLEKVDHPSFGRPASSVLFRTRDVELVRSNV